MSSALAALCSRLSEDGCHAEGYFSDGRRPGDLHLYEIRLQLDSARDIRSHGARDLEEVRKKAGDLKKVRRKENDG